MRLIFILGDEEVQLLVLVSILPLPLRNSR